MSFDYSLDYKTIDFREHPELYRVGVGEQGVLMVEPYKSEILPHWRFKTPEIAQKSSAEIHALFLRYKAANDFVGMDMARKFLQMGYTRARRYANHPSGRKYVQGEIAPQAKDWATSEKAQSAQIFYEIWQGVRDDPEYQRQRAEHISRYGK
ncbi:hypothetical protein CCAX7_10420 [Capsulimonas corticalis]|uniref:Uncharacterized protein n=1 Tax=Capsulimonas corticalis TaxID=2219043 RepID=A0A402CUK0_9BACT|nr:DUF4385 domain-containing protein [Capsulimonas corticalis]BDI28991.1 hypothetical protein CCAX7_10420 [Capsulimonas corticalis]